MKARMRKLSALMLATAVVFSMSGCSTTTTSKNATKTAEASTESGTTEAAATETPVETETKAPTEAAATEAESESETEAPEELKDADVDESESETLEETADAVMADTESSDTEEETVIEAVEELTEAADTEEETTEAAGETEEETTEAAVTEEETTEAAETEEETTEAAETEEETTEAAETEEETTEAATEAESDSEADSESSEKPGAGKTLRVAMECSYAPYNWTQPDDSNGAEPISGGSDYAYGYDVMMAQHICDELGYELEIVKLDWDSLVPAVQSGTVDCVIAGQSITSARAEMVDFSIPYYYASIITLTKSDSAYANAQSVADLAGATCTSQQNTVWYDVCLPQITDANILPAQESAPAMLVALDAGKCDIVVTDMPTGMAACVAYPEFTLLDFSGSDGDYEVSDEEINIGISMQKGNTELKEQIDSVLSQMTVDDYTAMMDQAIAVQPLSE